MKKLVSVLVILTLIAVGVGSYLMGQHSMAPTVENSPVQISTPTKPTPETTPATPAVETTSPKLSVAPVADTTTELSTPQEQPFKETLYTVYVKADYLKSGSGVPVWDKYKMDISLGMNGMQKEVFKTSAQAGVPYVVIGAGYGDADGYIQILDISTGATGYTNGNWFAQEVGDVETQKPAETKKPTENQKPAEQKPAEQKPAETQKPAEQKKPTNDGAGRDYYTPETSDRATIPEEDQTHDGGESAWTRDGTIGAKYTGKISG